MIFIAAPFGNYIKSRRSNVWSVTGSWTKNERRGRYYQLVRSLRYRNGVWCNAVGLRNPGFQRGIQKHARGSVFSIAAIDKEDWKFFSENVPEDIDIEVNLSCPNIEEFEPDWDNIQKLITGKRQWCIFKISPTTTTTELDKLYEVGVRQIHASNTLKTEYGGLSGKTLQPYTMNLIKIMKKRYKDTTIIAGGGVVTPANIEAYLTSGANHVSIGTVCFNPVKLYKILKNA